MKVTLLQFQEAYNTEYDEKESILQVKRFLSHNKRKGMLFFQEKVTILNASTPFELYYYLTPNRKTVKDAFPIPTKDFVFYQDRKTQFEIMRHFFESYYLEEINDIHYFEQYNYNKPFVGTHYLWFFKQEQSIF
ncbi:hypothetical protein ACJ2A9_06000 [Anaerobacillus sp. MEB173]|uniref:hypothetical protein n=1 Tax=Anaerobacillus sp. MEB173 TaxID=3383345 RepID=UPI003F8F23AC